MTAKVTGLQEAMNAIRELNDLAGDQVLEEALRQVGKPMAEEMAATCPRESGLTADDFGVALAKDDIDQGTVRLLVGARAGKRGRAFIANFIEFGTYRQPARPFMRPIADAHRATYSRNITKALQPAYDRVVKRLARVARSRGASK